MKNEYVCIVCPVSCRVTVEDDNGELKITGYTCKRGEKYAKNEHTDPHRMLTTTVKINGGVLPRLPVISSTEIPKSRMDECLGLLYELNVEAPVRCGDVIAGNILGLDADILAARTMPAE